MNESLSARHRSQAAKLAAAILPGAEGQPGASEIYLEQQPLDRVFEFRPDLLSRFENLLDRFDGSADDFLGGLEEYEFNLLMMVICSAYVLDDRVRSALGYPGQQALTPNRGGFGAEELVMEMMRQPKRYRRV